MSLGSITSYFRSCWETLCFRRSSFQSPINNQQGQAIIEYILLAVAILTFGYALGRQFFPPLQKYGTSVFTSTIACALEYGQLQAEIRSEDGCSASLQVNGFGAGSSSGRPGRGNSGKNGNGANDSAAANAKGKDSEGKNESAKKGNETGGSSASSSSSGSGGGGRGSGVSTVVSRNGTLQLGKSAGTENRTAAGRGEIVYDTSDSGGDGDFSYGSSLGRRRKPRYKPIGSDELVVIESRKKKAKVVDNGGRGIAGGSGAEGDKPKKMTLSSRQDVKKTVEKQEEWDMSRLLRIALIILMIVAILIFVFFQVSQIRKGSSS